MARSADVSIHVVDVAPYLLFMAYDASFDGSTSPQFLLLWRSHLHAQHTTHTAISIIEREVPFRQVIIFVANWPGRGCREPEDGGARVG